MKTGKGFLLVSSIMLFLIGSLSLYTNINSISELDGETNNILFKIMMFFLPSCFMLAGIIVALAIAIVRWRFINFVYLIKYLGLKLAILPVLLYGCAIVVKDENSLQIFNAGLISVFKLEAIETNLLNIAVFITLSFLVQVYLFGLEILEEDYESNAYNITRAITRLLFITGFSIVFYNGFFTFEAHYKMNTLIYASCICWYMAIFQYIREKSDYSTIKMILFTFLSLLAFLGVLLLIYYVGGLFNWLGRLTIFIPITGIAVCLSTLRTKFAMSIPSAAGMVVKTVFGAIFSVFSSIDTSSSNSSNTTTPDPHKTNPIWDDHFAKQNIDSAIQSGNYDKAADLEKARQEMNRKNNYFG